MARARGGSVSVGGATQDTRPPPPQCVIMGVSFPLVSSGSRPSRSMLFAARSYGALHARGRNAVPQAAMGAPDASSHRASSGSSSSQARDGSK